MSTLQFLGGSQPQIESEVALPPSSNISNALSSNHGIDTGIDELIDNAIDAEATQVQIVLHVRDHFLKAITVHDDGIGMNETKLVDSLRLGSHQNTKSSTIGSFGMGMKEGSFSNAEQFLVISRQKGASPVGYQVKKDTFMGGKLSEKSTWDILNLRPSPERFRSGTTVAWIGILQAYGGPDPNQAEHFLSGLLSNLKLHLGIRYHRFLESKRIQLVLYVDRGASTVDLAPSPKPISPFGYRNPGNPKYPVRLTVDGEADSPGVVAHIWQNRRDVPQFNLEAKNDLGHQGLYFYVGDRLVTSGGWSGLRRAEKSLKLLRFEIHDPRIINEFVRISPQKNSVRLEQGFHDFFNRLRSPDDPRIDIPKVLLDAAYTLKESNKKSGNATQLAEPGKGISPEIKATIDEVASIHVRKPLNIIWGPIPNNEFHKVDHPNATVTLNKAFRPYFTQGRGSLNDAPVLKTLIYLLYSEILQKDRLSAKAQADIEVRSSILNSAISQMVADQPQTDPIATTHLGLLF